MPRILHLDSSPRAERSHSRTLTQTFIAAWKEAHPEDTVAYRDIGRNPVPHVDEAWVAAAFSPPEQRTPELAAAIALSDELIDEFVACDRYVFGIPMYNLNVPSVFKAYIDQIVRVGKTFTVTDKGYEGLMEGKKMLIITARGGTYPEGTPMAKFDCQEPYLRTIFGFIGIADIAFIHADNLNVGEAARRDSLAEAKDAIAQAVASW
ncbi:MAG: FMN-dependent NADH-azoreductase [Cyanobacteriota bacterium]|nr:FMN-dependent NADH-azoreductase [Cyanobacteriota bacterium]